VTCVTAAIAMMVGCALTPILSILALPSIPSIPSIMSISAVTSGGGPGNVQVAPGSPVRRVARPGTVPGFAVQRAGSNYWGVFEPAR
jgi:hypothetical protein